MADRRRRPAPGPPRCRSSTACSRPGGLPHGRITLLAAAGRGPSGRLTLLQSLVALASRSHDTGYVDLAGSIDPGFLADLGADLDACLVISPGPAKWERGLVMARSLW